MTVKLTEVLFAGRSIQDPRLYQALKELDDSIEKILGAVIISPERQVGIGGFANESILLDLAADATRRLGLGLPRLTITDRNGLRNPPPGTLVHNASLNCLSFYNGTRWVDLGWSAYYSGTFGSSGAAETELLAITLPQSLLNQDGTWLEWQAGGTLANNANAKRIRVYLGATLIFDTTSSATLQNKEWQVFGSIYRDAVNSQRCQSWWGYYQPAWALGNNLSGGNPTATEDLSTSLILKVTGLGVANNDVIGNTLSAKLVG